MPESLRRVEELTGKKVEFEEMDILDKAALQGLFEKVRGETQGGPGAWPQDWDSPKPSLPPLLSFLQHNFVAVIHFAGLKAVGESVQKPLDYYRVNLTGTIQLLEVRGSG